MSNHAFYGSSWCRGSWHAHRHRDARLLVQISYCAYMHRPQPVRRRVYRRVNSSEAALENKACHFEPSLCHHV